jgi:tetratricopeptide (TPR) repeat protein
MRAVAVFVAMIMLAAASWNKYITRGGLVEYYDRHPKAATGAAVMCNMGKAYEIVGNYQKMYDIHGRVVERYPNTPQAMESAFGQAFALERLGDYRAAIEKYEAFLEKYPNSKYARSVRNNVEILKSR